MPRFSDSRLMQFEWYAAYMLTQSLPFRKKFLLFGPQVTERAALIVAEKPAFLLGCMLSQKERIATEQILDDSTAPQSWRSACAHIEDDLLRRWNAQPDKENITYEQFFPESSPSRPNAGDLLSSELCMDAIRQRVLLGLILGLNFPATAIAMAEAWVGQSSTSRDLGVGGISVEDSPLFTSVESGLALAQTVYEEWLQATEH